MVPVDSNDAVATDQLLTCFTIDMQLLVWMLEALKALLDGRNEIDHVSSQLVQADDHVRRQLLPLRVDVLALVAEEAAGAAVARRLSFLALVAFAFGRGAHLSENVSDVEQVVHEEGSLQARYSALGQMARLAAVGTLDS